MSASGAPATTSTREHPSFCEPRSIGSALRRPMASVPVCVESGGAYPLLASSWFRTVLVASMGRVPDAQATSGRMDRSFSASPCARASTTATRPCPRCGRTTKDPANASGEHTVSERSRGPPAARAMTRPPSSSASISRTATSSSGTTSASVHPSPSSGKLTCAGARASTGTATRRNSSHLPPMASR